MIYNLENPYEVSNFKDDVEKMIEKKSIVEMKKKNKNRSVNQNNYLHLILSFFACELGYSLDEVKYEYFKKLCNRDIFERKKINKKGNEITYYRSSSDLDTMEMTTAIERFRNYSAAQAGVYLPSPNEGDYLLYIQQEIERNKEFI